MSCDGPTDATPAARVRDLRSALGLTQEQMAQQLQVSFATVNRWEMGRRAPSPSSQRRLDTLAARTRSGIAGPSGAAGTREPSATSLLVPPTSFVGRQRELDELEGLLKANRLVTLTGPGGSGKTRLAMELIRRSTKPGDSVTVVALDVVIAPELVVSAFCAALGLRDTAGVAPGELLVSHLASRPQLLVLDNCEHVTEVVSQLVTVVLMAAPDLKILATSRVVLGAAGEQVWPVPPLQLPAVGAGPPGVNRSDAGRLFVERARSRTVGRPELDGSASRRPSRAFFSEFAAVACPSRGTCIAVGDSTRSNSQTNTRGRPVGLVERLARAGARSG